MPVYKPWCPEQNARERPQACLRAPGRWRNASVMGCTMVRLLSSRGVAGRRFAAYIQGRGGVHEEVIATIPQGKTGAFLEVVLVHERPEQTRVELRHMSWGNGVGWYRQHTLKLDHATVRALGRLLTQVQHRLDHSRTPGADNKIIPFPSVGPACQREHGARQRV